MSRSSSAGSSLRPRRGARPAATVVARGPDKLSSSLYFSVFHPPSILRDALLLLLLHSLSDLVKWSCPWQDPRAAAATGTLASPPHRSHGYSSGMHGSSEPNMC